MTQRKQLHELMIITSVIKNVIIWTGYLIFVQIFNTEDLNYDSQFSTKLKFPMYTFNIWNSITKGFTLNSNNSDEAFVYLQRNIAKGYLLDLFTFLLCLKHVQKLLTQIIKKLYIIASIGLLLCTRLEDWKHLILVQSGMWLGVSIWVSVSGSCRVKVGVCD